MPRHAAPEHDCLRALLTPSWAALNLAGAALLGLAVHDVPHGNTKQPCHRHLGHGYQRGNVAAEDLYPHLPTGGNMLSPTRYPSFEQAYLAVLRQVSESFEFANAPRETRVESASE
jgi:hypothetical protein